ncbi:MAG: hypothetical protein JNG85_16280 [Spirochaetaceae bacterium]|nr:hypothetical protein [Spirochaetaceae bacterium]
MSDRTKSAATEPQARVASPSEAAPRGPAGTRVLIAALAWIGAILLSVVLTGCPRFSPLYALYLGASLLLVAGELLFVRAIWFKGKVGLYPGWKKFTGYSLPAYYALHALPRVEWGNAGLIGQGRGTFIFALTLLVTAAGAAAFFLAGRLPSLVAFGVLSAEEAADPVLRKKRAREHRRRGPVAFVLDWVDALAWAAIAVLIVNCFVFQLYEVPSESMVPAFLVGDRPFTLKLASGPRIPLTEARLPALRPWRRGDVATIANPRYPENHRVDLKKNFSQFVFMLTFTGVNLDAKLPDGSPKADPLVKRIVGLPGERLMMVDDALYARRAGDADFSRVDEPWARSDLWKEEAALRSRFRELPIDEGTRSLLAAWDRRKNEAEPAALAAAVEAARARIEASLARLTPSRLSAFEARELPRAGGGLAERRADAVAAAAAGGDPFSSAGPQAEDLSLALAAAGDPMVRASLRAYAAGALTAAAKSPADAYEKGSRALNLIIKANLLTRVDRDLALLAAGSPIEAFGGDAERNRLLGEARELYVYLQGFYDARNFGSFPSADSYLGPDEFFAMGDNRYNSLDFRYALAPSSRALDPGDPASVRYASLLAPFPLQGKFIEGLALFRLWPPSRVGAIR